jgi:fermentation-respiration switch protein FrsA (DUF1100 family)
MLSAIETRMLFFPRKASEDWLPAAEMGLHAEDVQLTGADGVRIHAWWCPLEAGRNGQGDSAILYSHGNAGNLSHRAVPILELQHALGLPVLIYDYPGYGKSEGKPNERGCYAAADAAFDWLVQKGIAPERIVQYGESLGGGIAVELAKRRPHRALVLVRTFTSIPDMAQVQFPFLPLRWLVRNRFDNLAKIDQCAGPTLIAHGDCDSLIPFDQAERLFKKAREPKMFLEMHGCEHNDVLSPVFYQTLHDLLERGVATQKPSATQIPQS